VQSQIQETKEELIWPDASPDSKATSIRSNVSSVKRQEAAAEDAATRAVLRIMTEQECHQEKLQRLEVENKRIVADQEEAALTQRLQGEREETERRIEKETQEASLLKKQQEENAARKSL